MPKWVYPLSFAFVLFLIFRNGEGAGDSAGEFAGFIVDMLSAVGEFLTGLFEGAGEASTSDNSFVDNMSDDPPQPLPSASESVDSFTHSHGGLGEHTHTIDSDHNVGN